MEKKLTTYQMAVTALMAAVMCVLGPLSVPIGAIPISLTNLVICFSAWLLGPKFGTLSVAVYLALGAVGLPVFSGYGAGLAKLAGPTASVWCWATQPVMCWARRGSCSRCSVIWATRWRSAFIPSLHWTSARSWSPASSVR